jgi:hypothetical protein
MRHAAESKALLEQVSIMLNTGEELMFTMDVPYIPEQQAPIVLADKGSAPAMQPDYILHGCQAVSSSESESPESAERGIDPALVLALYISRRDYATGDHTDDLRAAVKNPILLEGPKHGRIHVVDEKGYGRVFRYEPVPNYEGKDSVSFMVEFKGNYYKIVIELVVVEMTDIHVDECPSLPRLIKVNDELISDVFDIKNYNTPDSWRRATSLYALLSGAKDALTGFADLSGSALGSTSANKITLDTDAAGYNWFINYTPYLNEEWLPTSNPLGMDLSKSDAFLNLQANGDEHKSQSDKVKTIVKETLNKPINRGE